MVGQILAIRAQVEELVVDEESLAYLGEIGQQASLRFSLCFEFFLYFGLVLSSLRILRSNLAVFTGMRFSFYHPLVLWLK